MHISSSSFGKLISMLIIFVFSLSSCVDWESKVANTSIVRTDVLVKVIVKGAGTDLPMANEGVTWNIHLFNVATNTITNLASGVVTTDNNGEVFLPVYECQLNAGKIVRVIAYLSGQDTNTNPPVIVYFDDALDAANSENFADISVDYLILK